MPANSDCPPRDDNYTLFTMVEALVTHLERAAGNSSEILGRVSGMWSGCCEDKPDVGPSICSLLDEAISLAKRIVADQESTIGRIGSASACETVKLGGQLPEPLKPVRRRSS
jgi:hypothetical protein